MGERRSEGGLAGRGPRHALLESEVEALIVASLVRDGVDAEAEQRAVAAFRDARGAGARWAHTRRRDDWRPGERRRHLGRSLRTTLGVLLASLTLGGVAVAAIGAAGSSPDGPDGGREHPPVSSGAPRDPAPAPPRDGDADHGSGTGPGSAPARPDRPVPARDAEAQCRAYRQVQSRGKAMDATAWRRLVDAAGGERNITEYCAAHLAPATPEPKPSRSGGAGNKGPVGKEGADTSRGKGTPARPNGRPR
ncbi:hypothetical protein ABZ499_01980 [Streptomyces sp. NPDC019990]|uniref:hypothetical protein n=1 Tax=Streptomyces sp. NPDC019990 TaxID=3154693 RepID=UPI0033DA36D6